MMILHITKDSHPEIFEELNYFYHNESYTEYDNNSDCWRIKSIIKIDPLDCLLDNKHFPNTNLKEIEGFWESPTYRTVNEFFGTVRKGDIHELYKVERKEIETIRYEYIPIKQDELQN